MNYKDLVSILENNEASKVGQTISDMISGKEKTDEPGLSTEDIKNKSKNKKANDMDTDLTVKVSQSKKMETENNDKGDHLSI